MAEQEGAGMAWTCGACKRDQHWECEVMAVKWVDDGGSRPVCACPCEPTPLPGFPGAQPSWPPPPGAAAEVLPPWWPGA